MSYNLAVHISYPEHIRDTGFKIDTPNIAKSIELIILSR